MVQSSKACLRSCTDCKGQRFCGAAGGVMSFGRPSGPEERRGGSANSSGHGKMSADTQQLIDRKCPPCGWVTMPRQALPSRESRLAR